MDQVAKKTATPDDMQELTDLMTESVSDIVKRRTTNLTRDEDVLSNKIERVAADKAEIESSGLGKRALKEALRELYNSSNLEGVSAIASKVGAR